MKTKEQLLEFIRAQKVSFIASVDENGFPNMKAMLPPRLIEGNCFYFTTNTGSKRAGQYRENNKASIYFYNKGRFHYEGLMLVGTMEVLTDEESKERIWLPTDKLYYKKGVTDPDYCVLRFTAQNGRHYLDFKHDNIDWE